MPISYRECSNDATVMEHNRTACFAKIFGNGLDKRTTKLFMYEATGTFRIPIDMIPKWVAVMNEFGFPVEYLGEKPDKEYDKFNIPKGNHVFYIDCTQYLNKPHLCSALTLLRYMYEFPNYADLIKYFFEVTEKHPELDRFKVLQLAFLKAGNGDGHTCHINPKCEFSTREEIFKNFEGQKSEMYSATRPNINGCWSVKNPVTLTVDFKNPVTMYNTLNKTKRLKVYVVGKAKGYANWLPDVDLVEGVKQADLVLFTGGEDVDPSMYDEPKGKNTWSNLNRDLTEKKIFDEAVATKKLMLGVCRGSQFLCVMNGGKLVQQVRKVTVKTLPTAMIDSVTVDISHLELGSVLRIKSIEIPEGVEIMANGSIPIANVEIPRALKSAAAEEKKAEGKKK